MLRRRYCQSLSGMFFLLFAQVALSQNMWLTDGQFQSVGAGEFLGTILSVQVSSTAPSFESGTVELQVNQVIAGTITASTVTFPYQKALVSSDDPSNWDLIGPLGSSLKKAVGDELLVYVTTSGGVYSLYPASDSIQAVTSGLLLGTIESIESNRGDSLNVEIKVSETVYGWVKGTTVTLPLPKKSLTVWGQTPSAANFVSSGWKVNFIGAGPDPFSLPFQMLDANFCNSNQGKQFVIAFSNGEITGLQLASKALIDKLQKSSTW